jgi:hypothetical protein
MFRFADKGKVFWPVALRQSNDAGDAVEDVTVHFAYTLLPRTELRAREKRGIVAAADRLAEREGPRTADDLIAVFDATVEREDGDVAFLLDHVSDWRGVADGDEAVEFSRDRLEALLQFDVYFRPIMAGLLAASRSGPAKNSQPGSGGMPAPAQA